MINNREKEVAVKEESGNLFYERNPKDSFVDYLEKKLKIIG